MVLEDQPLKKPVGLLLLKYLGITIQVYRFNKVICHSLKSDADKVGSIRSGATISSVK